ncbi:MAG TPA: hypothetical protein VER79_06840 [Candidatus Limnocylindrales bacterium]|nr:hypothetical protein [Candidatus Limnocylindrales bacterium]
MTRKGTILLILALMGGWTAMGIHAQESGTEHPLIVTGRSQSSGDRLFFRYADGAWEPLLAEGVADGSAAPGGEQVAILKVPPFLETIEGGRDWLSGSAWDIALVEVGDDTQRDIALQSTAIAANENGSGYSGGITRSVPVWSPHGRAFAWTEQDYPAQSSARLLVYDLDSDETRVLDDALPFMNLSSDGLPVEVTWRSGGIVVFTNDSADFADTLRHYDAQTGLQQIVRLPQTETDGYWYPLLGPLWLVDSANAPIGAAVIAPTLGDGTMYTVDWASADVRLGFSRRYEMVSASHPDESLRLIWSFYNRALDPSEPLLQLVMPDGAVALTWEDFLGTDDPQSLRRIVFSPSGHAAAYLQDGELSIREEGGRRVVPLPPDFTATNLQWGDSMWRLGEPYNLDAVG